MKRNIEHRLDVVEQHHKRGKITPVLTINGVSAEEFLSKAWQAGREAQEAGVSRLIVPGMATDAEAWEREAVAQQRTNGGN